jgi:hypothetical protein
MVSAFRFSMEIVPEWILCAVVVSDLLERKGDN